MVGQGPPTAVQSRGCASDTAFAWRELRDSRTGSMVGQGPPYGRAIPRLCFGHRVRMARTPRFPRRFDGGSMPTLRFIAKSSIGWALAHHRAHHVVRGADSRTTQSAGYAPLSTHAWNEE